MRTPLTLTLFLATTFCFAQIGAKTKQSTQLSGLWQNDQFGYQMTLMLNPDGTGEFDGEAIKYSTQPGVLVLTMVAQQETTKYNYTLSGNALTLTGGDLDQAVTFKRSGTEATPSPVTNTGTPSTIATAGGSIDKNLLGVWSGNGETIEFKPTGEVIYLGNTFKYEANQGHVSLITNQGNVMFQYAVVGTQLTMMANGQKVVYQKGANNGGGPMPNGSGRQVPQELVGKWCWINVNNTNSGGSSSDECIILNGDGSYQYYSERSMSVNTPGFSGGTSSQGSDQGTWFVQGDRIFYNSASRGQGSYRLEKRNHPRNVNDPMIILDGQPYVTAFQKAPWR